MESAGSGSSQVKGFSEHVEQPPVSVNHRQIFIWLRDKELLKKEPAEKGRYNIVRESRGIAPRFPFLKTKTEDRLLQKDSRVPGKL